MNEPEETGEELSQNFYELTPDRVLDSAQELGFNVTGHCQALNSLENRVFDVLLDDRTAIVMKFYRPHRWSKEQLQEEHDFLYELVEDELPVIAPLKIDKASVFKNEEIYFSIWPRIGGREPEELTPEQLTSLGSLLARMHLVGERKPFEHRQALNPVNFITSPLELIKPMLPDIISDRYLESAQQVAEKFTDLSVKYPVHRIHGDCHKGNLLLVNDGFLFLDFDDSMSGPAVQDFWMLASTGDEQTAINLQLLAEGYSRFKDFDNGQLAMVEVLRAVRFIHYSGWIARRWNDKSFHNVFPHFATDKYWIDETNDLEKQIEKFSEPRIIDDSPGLSNSDYFFDWEG